MARIELDQKIKPAIQDWQRQTYKGVSPVTKRLLEYWFKEEHLLEDNTKFEFWRCQKEAVETLIYIYEVCKCTSLYELGRSFEVSLPVDPTKDLWPKYCFKMATGSGKTFIMTFALLWQYFNKIFGTDNGLRYSSHFLLLAPNLIVFDRLWEDLKDKKIFKQYPFVPKEWGQDFDLQPIKQSEARPAHSKGILHVTNIQQLYERPEGEEENPIQELLGPRPKREEEVVYEGLLNELQGYDDLLVMNDEAHHVHSDDLEWNKTIGKLDRGIKENFGHGLLMQLDFSATPKDLEGRLFSHIVYDYPLAEAVIEKIVKRPRIGFIENIPESLSKDFVKRNQYQIDTGIEILKKFKEEFKETEKKPVLFIMTDNTPNADKVGKYLEEKKGFQGKVLVIHTDKAGVITKKDLEKARLTAREIDKPDSPIEVIVSVMMLKEGWDVRSVCVIAPLRAFDSPVLPEQTLGRGLRRIFPTEKDLVEKLVVIDHPRFRALFQAEIDEGELVADLTTIAHAYEPNNRVYVDPKKLEYDIEIPIIEGGLQRTVPDLSKVKPKDLPRSEFKLSEIEIPKVMYKEKDLLEQKIVRQMALGFDYTENAQLYLSYLTKAILTKVGATAMFAELVPKVQEYIENFLFDERIDLENLEVVKKLNYMPIREKVFDIFTTEINKHWLTEEIPPSCRYCKVSDTPSFHTSESVHPAKKTVFNAIPHHKRSEFEKDFMKYLDGQDDVLAFTKVLSRFPLKIPYIDNEGYTRYYIPDFIIKTEKESFLIETKGMKEEELSLKVKEAVKWCERVGSFTGRRWLFCKIQKEAFERYEGQSFKSLIMTTKANV